MRIVNEVTQQYAQGTDRLTKFEQFMKKEAELNAAKLKLKQIKAGPSILKDLKALQQEHVGQVSSQLTFDSEKFKHSIFDLNLIDRSFERSVKEQVNFGQATTIFCVNRLLAFYWGRPIRVV